MYCSLKATIEIPDELYRRVKARSAACALARRVRDSSIADAVEARLRSHPTLALRAVDDELLTTARLLGASRFLRAVDRLYLATAALEDAALVTWNNKPLSRAEALSPEQVLQDIAA